MILLLLGAAAVYLVLGDARDAVVLSVSVIVVMAITAVQERKSERALDALRDLSSPRALVIRDGAECGIAGVEVVCGDLLVLSEGDRVPADARLASATELRVDESLLTGESVSVEKVPDAAGREGRVYSGTLVIKGHGKAVVTATGARAEMGRIGVSLASVPPEKTTLELETARIVRVIAAGALVLCLLLGVYYAATRGDLFGGILAGLTLAIAILPEEFPVVLTVFLALGAWRISQQRVLTRRMPAIEMLGAATVLCVDKTGTLTENRMAVAEVFDGVEWHPGDRLGGHEGVRALLDAAAFACELQPFDPMDRAILRAAEQALPSIRDRRNDWRLEKDYPFGASFLAMCHGWRSPLDETRVVIKGAPETVLPLCGLDEIARSAADAQAVQAAARGLRLLAVAEGRPPQAGWPEDPASLRFGWLGFIALADPLRQTVPEAVAQCRRAGIRVVMITGDHAVTAAAIARQAGIAQEASTITGAQLESMSEAELAQAVKTAQVFARVLPEQKLKLIAAYKSAGEVVAMTGDGVNDAPALKAAHIGISMGKRGTDVAREASDLVLLDDDFGTLVATVRQGRRIYENIRSAMAYLLAVHVPIAGMSFVPLLFGWPLVLFPIHVLFLEFVIDPACSIVFEAEQSDESAMDRPPRPPAELLFNTHMLTSSLLLGATALLAIFVGYAWIIHAGRAEGEARAFAFAAIVFANLALILSSRSRGKPLLATLRVPNRALWWVMIGSLCALAAAIYLPQLAGVFRFEALAPADLLLALAFACAGVFWGEPVKVLRRSSA